MLSMWEVCGSSPWLWKDSLKTIFLFTETESEGAEWVLKMIQPAVKSATASKYSELVCNTLSITAKWVQGGTLLVQMPTFECLVIYMKCQSHGLAHCKHSKMSTIILVISSTLSGKKAGLFPSDKHPSRPALPPRLPSCFAMFWH